MACLLSGSNSDASKSPANEIRTGDFLHEGGHIQAMQAKACMVSDVDAVQSLFLQNKPTTPPLKSNSPAEPIAFREIAAHGIRESRLLRRVSRFSAESGSFPHAGKAPVNNRSRKAQMKGAGLRAAFRGCGKSGKTCLFRTGPTPACGIEAFAAGDNALEKACFYDVLPAKGIQPLAGNALPAVDDAGKGAGDSRGGVGVIA